MVKRYWIRPRPRALALVVFGVAVFSVLCVWQVDRGHEKERLFAAFAGAARQAPQTLDAARGETARPVYPRVHVRGRYDSRYGYVLDDRQHAGQLGRMLFAVFMPDAGGPPLLVNRGFLADREGVAAPAVPTLPAGETTLDALYAPPPGVGFRMGGNALARQSQWPKSTIYLDLGEVSADIGARVDPRILLLLPAPGTPFVRDWTPQVFPPARHYGYALTWLAFAVVAVAIFIGMHWRAEPAST